MCSSQKLEFRQLTIGSGCPAAFSSFYLIRIIIQLGRVTKRERKKRSSVLSLSKWLQCLGLDQAKTKTHRSFFWAFHVGDRYPSFGAMFCCFFRPLAGSWIKSGAVRLRLAHTWECWVCRNWFNLLCYNTSASHFLF